MEFIYITIILGLWMPPFTFCFASPTGGHVRPGFFASLKTMRVRALRLSLGPSSRAVPSPFLSPALSASPLAVTVVYTRMSLVLAHVSVTAAAAF